MLKRDTNHSYEAALTVDAPKSSKSEQPALRPDGFQPGCVYLSELLTALSLIGKNVRTPRTPPVLLPVPTNVKTPELSQPNHIRTDGVRQRHEGPAATLAVTGANLPVTGSKLEKQTDGCSFARTTDENGQQRKRMTAKEGEETLDSQIPIDRLVDKGRRQETGFNHQNLQLGDELASSTYIYDMDPVKVRSFILIDVSSGTGGRNKSMTRSLIYFSA